MNGKEIGMLKEQYVTASELAEELGVAMVEGTSFAR
jgi:hypothetical protein